MIVIKPSKCVENRFEEGLLEKFHQQEDVNKMSMGYISRLETYLQDINARSLEIFEDQSNLSKKQVMLCRNSCQGRCIGYGFPMTVKVMLPYNSVTQIIRTLIYIYIYIY